MKAFVIAIEGHAQSQAAAARCIASAARFGVRVIRLAAVTPAREPAMIAARCGVDIKGFNGNRYSRFEPCLAAFLSHRALWLACASEVEPYLILEHDAVFVAPLPDLSRFVGLCNLGAPSFGLARRPADGIGPLASKDFLPGAHAYYLTPDAAEVLCDVARTEACPTDVFLHRDRFPFLFEYHPWPIECHETFTTIQQEAGCVAKHRRVEIV